MDIEKCKYLVIIILCCYVLGVFIARRQTVQPTLAEPLHGYEQQKAERQSTRVTHSKEGGTNRLRTDAAIKGDASGTTTSLSAVGHMCSQESRITLYKSVCRKGSTPLPTFTVRQLYLDTDNKLASCINKKAGSVSWFKFLIHNKYPGFNAAHPTYHKDPFMKSHGFNNFFQIPKENVTDQYKDWPKIIVVRHPLQRAVSGYYQALVTGNGEATTTMKMTFLEFIQKLVTEQLNNIVVKIMWMRYYIACCVCDIDYDFIVKQETLEQDVETFKEWYNFRKDNDMTHADLNRKVSLDDVSDTRFKYDEMLGKFQDEHPELMRGLLNHYKYDMELFGYGWDWDQRKSFCVDKTASGCC